jgi:ribosomal-protein-alanine N-acetyltransferase
VAAECVLQTKRLIVRLPRLEDAPAIAEFYRSDEAHMREFTPATPPMLTVEFWEGLIPRIRDEFYAGLTCRTFLVEPDDRTIFGSANISNVMRGPFQACYLGYNIAGTHEGKGLMREALQALIAFAFEELNLHRIMANYMPHNERSAALLRRLGFVVEGTAREYLRIGGSWEDHVLTSLTNQTWRSNGHQ